MRTSLTIIALLLMAWPIAAAEPEQAAPHFALEIEPILANLCYDCHGPDDSRRQGDLRLDKPDAWFQPREQHAAIIVPGEPSKSELIARLTTSDADRRMPPPHTRKQVSPTELRRLEAWIASGAKWAKHWSYESPTRPALPAVRNAAWPRNAIDYFVLQHLELRGLTPQTRADRATLLRRVTFDITGLPPTSAELASFLADDSPQAYERVVDRLLASPRYGERMAQVWLDLARYADTHGYHSDSQREAWRWRDVLIERLNANQPFDQFTLEQLAGDLLPNATLEQQIASGFQRHHMINFENGAIPEEYRTEYVIDRVVTTGSVWLGQTWLCARCHDHKYDTISQRDFYRMFAYFNQVAENGLDGRSGNAVPFIPAPTKPQQQQLATLVEQEAKLQAAIAMRKTEGRNEYQAWSNGTRESGNAQPPSDAVIHRTLDEVAPDEIQGHARFAKGRAGQALLCDGETSLRINNGPLIGRSQPVSASLWVFATSTEPGTLLARVDDAFTSRGLSLAVEDDTLIWRLVNDVGDEITVKAVDALPSRKWRHIGFTYDGSGRAAGVKLYVGENLVDVEVTHDTLTSPAISNHAWQLGLRGDRDPFRGLLDELQLFSRALSPTEMAQLAGGNPIERLLAIPRASRSPAEEEQLSQHFWNHIDPRCRELQAELVQARRQREALERSFPTAMVMNDAHPRSTHILTRGLYNQPASEVTAGVPDHIFAGEGSYPPNRLGLARWLTHPRHPLTARVQVNRLWQQLWGRGLVPTPDDFGVRGAPPSHPELLDWLAVEFVESGWNQKHLLRLMLTSTAYQQASQATKTQERDDPSNQHLARGPRKRLSAEAIRDAALTAADCLDTRLGGPSVNPRQAGDAWKDLAYNTQEYSAQSYRASSGADLYRRGIYTFWKRAAPPIMLSLFDAPNRETCTLERPCTSSPLQALAMWNDLFMVEMARVTAQHAMRAATNERQCLDELFARLLARRPREREAKELLALYRAELATYRADTTAAEKLLAVGDGPRDRSLDAGELAAWTNVAQAIMSFAEFQFLE